MLPSFLPSPYRPGCARRRPLCSPCHQPSLTAPRPLRTDSLPATFLTQPWSQAYAAALASVSMPTAAVLALASAIATSLVHIIIVSGSIESLVLSADVFAFAVAAAACASGAPVVVLVARAVPQSAQTLFLPLRLPPSERSAAQGARSRGATRGRRQGTWQHVARCAARAV